MIEAIRKLRRAGHPVFFDIVGSAGKSGTALEARQAVDSDPQLRDHVRFWGRVSDAEVQERLIDSDALLFSRRSGRQAQAAFPTRLPEFLITGRPVISSAVGDIPEFLEDGRDAILVQPDNAASLASGIERLMREPDRGRRIGLNGFRKCHEHFHARSRGRETSAFLEEVCRAPRRPRCCC
jgi:glycosyltransferase involved in cell wall biosynthesis